MSNHLNRHVLKLHNTLFGLSSPLSYSQNYGIDQHLTGVTDGMVMVCLEMGPLHTSKSTLF